MNYPVKHPCLLVSKPHKLLSEYALHSSVAHVLNAILNCRSETLFLIADLSTVPFPLGIFLALSAKYTHITNIVHVCLLPITTELLIQLLLPTIPPLRLSMVVVAEEMDHCCY
jgi:hypothetical protein